MKVNISNLFISPVTGRVLCENGKWLKGDAHGIAVPSVIIPMGGLPDLSFNQQWVGDSSNRPVEMQYLGSIPFIVRTSTPLIPNSQSLDSLGLGLIKVIANGTLAHALPVIDYATVAFEASLVALSLIDLAAASTNKNIAQTSQEQAQVSQDAAAADETLAHEYDDIAHNYYNMLLAVTLNQLPNFGDVDINHYRLKNVAQSPVEDFDVVGFTFLWDMMHDSVDVSEVSAAI